MDFRHILIVDDSATSRMIIRRCFEMAGCAEAIFHEAADGAEAIALLEKQPADLILSDIAMPKMDGLTLMRKIKSGRFSRETPVVIISSVGDDVVDEQFLMDYAFAVIQKPISTMKAAEVIERCRHE